MYEKLETKPINSAQELEHWLLERSELDAALSQAGSILYIRMTCQTDDPKIAGAYTKFVETIPPAIKPINDRLNHKYVSARSIFLWTPSVMRFMTVRSKRILSFLSKKMCPSNQGGFIKSRVSDRKWCYDSHL